MQLNGSRQHQLPVDCEPVLAGISSKTDRYAELARNAGSHLTPTITAAQTTCALSLGICRTVKSLNTIVAVKKPDNYETEV
jgi:hypothetical protein